MQASIAQKQQFLRLQILETGYDPEDFIQFMSTHSQIQSPTIQTLTMGQLQQVVADYKVEVQRRVEYSQQPQVKNNQSSGKSGKKIFAPDRIRLLEEKKNRVQYDKYGNFDYELKGTVKCIDAENLVKPERLQISVIDMETKETQGYFLGLGAKTDYYYKIQTNLMKGPVKRLSEDFDWLNNTLLRLYPNIVIPELEPVRKDIKDPYIKRQKQIQQYLQHLADKKFLMHSYAFIDFLTISSEKMQKYKKSYESMGFAKGVSLMKTEEGVVQIDLSNRSRQLYSSSRDFSRRTASLHETINQAISKMLQSYRLAMVDTYSVVDLFAQLHDCFTGEISNKFPNLKKEQYNDTLVNLNNLFLGIGDNLKSISDTLEKHTKDYYRFYAGLDRNLQKLQKMVKDSETQYLQFKQNLQRKKQRVVSDPTKWQIDTKQVDTKGLSRQQLMKLILPKQMQVQSQLRSWYAFNLKNYQNQFSGYLRYLTRRYQKVFKTVAVELLSDDKSYLQSITKFISDCRRTGQ